MTHAVINQRTLTAILGFDKVYVGNVEALRQKLFPWMLSHGFDVTEQMTLAELIDILVGEIIARYSVIGELLKVEDEAAAVIGNTIKLVNGATIDGTTLKARDT